MNTVSLNPQKLTFLRDVDPRLVSYNIEMTEVTGGTFWKPYTPAQIAGTEEFPTVPDVRELAKLLAVFQPADLLEPRVRQLAKALGPVYIRVSGSWATTTYYDFDGHTGGKAPEGFRAVLTRQQWEGVLDFVKYVDAKLLISVANCDGVMDENHCWDPAQAKLLFDFSRDYGVPISAVEFMNEPNTTVMSRTHASYTAEEFCRDQDAFYRFVRENYPDVVIVGPCASGDAYSKHTSFGNMSFWPTSQLLEGCREQADVFSYHMYHGISERGAAMASHWLADQATSEEYLGVPYEAANYYAPYRDKYCPGAPMWVTESADAGCGGDTWASTYLDVIRSADELGRFCTVTDGVIFHNTLMASDYAYLDHATHLPRPNYWLALLWNRLVGTRVFDTAEPVREGVHLYAHSRRDGKEGFVYILVNNSRTETTRLELPVDAVRYTLSAEHLRSNVMLLNGKPLELENDQLPALEGQLQPAGMVEAAPATVTFLVV